MSAVVYSTMLTKDECYRRLQRHNGRANWGWGWERWEEGTISANVRGDRFRLFGSGPLNIRNSFAPFYYGRLEESSGGTRIKGRFRLHPLVRVFLAVWFGGLAVMEALMLWLPRSAWGHGRPPPWWAPLGPVAMMMLGYGLILAGGWFARGQLESMQRFLSRELEAQLQS
jgi:hypothetical protein